MPDALKDLKLPDEVPDATTFIAIFAGLLLIFAASPSLEC
jgi:hypothetical protein